MSRVLSIPELSKLTRRATRLEAGAFVVEGKKILEEAVAAKFGIRQLLVTEKFLHGQREWLDQLGAKKWPVTVIAEHSAQRLSDAVSHPGIFGVINLPSVDFEQFFQATKIVALENIRDPGNLGTMIRTADWYGVKHILLSGDSADIYNQKVLRASMGSVFHLHIYTSDQFLSDLSKLKVAGFEILVTRPEEGAPVAATSDSKVCFVFGNESTGTTAQVDQLANKFYAVPRLGSAESLNVGVSFGIILDRVLGR